MSNYASTKPISNKLKPVILIKDDFIDSQKDLFTIESLRKLRVIPLDLNLLNQIVSN